MSRRTDGERDIVPRHENAIEWLHTFMGDLRTLAENKQLFHASPSQLAQWDGVRGELNGCIDIHFHYGHDFVHKAGQSSIHEDLILAVTSIVMELKARNAGAGQRYIELIELNLIELSIPSLNKCYKRVVWR